ncbi:hypothetical protein HDU76_007093, partial [Blyttiomyces sp. JEL0837]
MTVSNTLTNSVTIIYVQPDCSELVVGPVDSGTARVLSVADKQIFLARQSSATGPVVSSFQFSQNSPQDWSIAPSKPASSNNVILIGAGVGGALVLVVLGVGGFFFWKKRKDTINDGYVRREGKFILTNLSPKSITPASNYAPSLKNGNDSAYPPSLKSLKSPEAAAQGTWNSNNNNNNNQYNTNGSYRGQTDNSNNNQFNANGSYRGQNDTTNNNQYNTNGSYKSQSDNNNNGNSWGRNNSNNNQNNAGASSSGYGTQGRNNNNSNDTFGRNGAKDQSLSRQQNNNNNNGTFNRGGPMSPNPNSSAPTQIVTPQTMRKPTVNNSKAAKRASLNWWEAPGVKNNQSKDTNTNNQKDDQQQQQQQQPGSSGTLWKQSLSRTITGTLAGAGANSTKQFEYYDIQSSKDTNKNDDIDIDSIPTPESMGPGSRLRIIHPHIAGLEDEVTLYPGDAVILKETYGDG